MRTGHKHWSTTSELHLLKTLTTNVVLLEHPQHQMLHVSLILTIITKTNSWKRLSTQIFPIPHSTPTETYFVQTRTNHQCGIAQNKISLQSRMLPRTKLMDRNQLRRSPPRTFHHMK